MNFSFAIYLRLFVSVLILGAIASAGTITGTVKNVTRGKPSAGDDVVLIKLQGSMQESARTKTDASGHFNSKRLGTAEEINGPVTAINSVMLDPNGVTTQMTFTVKNKDGCTYRVTTSDVAEPGRGKDRITVELFPATQVGCSSPSQTGPTGTTLTDGNIQGHKG